MGRATDPLRPDAGHTERVLNRRLHPARPARLARPVRSAVLCGCLIAAAAAVAACGQFGPQSQRTSSYDVTQPVTRLVVQDGAGNVHVSAGSGSSTLIAVTEAQSYRGSPPNSSHTVSGGTLTLTYSCPNGGDCGIDYTVTVPAGLSVQVEADAGDVSLAGLGGAVQVRADAGDIRGSALDSPRATMTDSAGNVMLAFNAAPGDLSVLADAGNVEITVPGSAGYAVTANTAAGNTHVDVPTSTGSAHVIEAQSSAGNVSVLTG